MPNPQNIEAPITLFGNGRSGTSLLYRALVLHPDVDRTGETANLIFTTWRALEQISGRTRYGKIGNIDHGADAAKLVRQAFLTVFPSDKREWLQKPIGLPRIYGDFPGIEPDSDAFVAWYWQAFTRSFPASRNLAIIRDPRDVAISAKKYLGSQDHLIWRSLRFVYNALAYGRESFSIVVRYEDLIAQPVSTLKHVCAAVTLDYRPQMMWAFDKLHVPVKGTMFGTAEELAERRKRAFSHRDEHDQLVLDHDAKRTISRYHEILSLFALPAEEEQTRLM